MKKYSVEINASGKLWLLAKDEEEAEELAERVAEYLEDSDIPGLVFNVEPRMAKEESRGERGFHATRDDLERELA